MSQWTGMPNCSEAGDAGQMERKLLWKVLLLLSCFG